jgi:hypothetical protein
MFFQGEPNIPRRLWDVVSSGPIGTPVTAGTTVQRMGHPIGLETLGGSFYSS